MTEQEREAVAALVLAAAEAYGYIRAEVREHAHAQTAERCGGTRVQQKLREALGYWCDPETL